MRGVRGGMPLLSRERKRTVGEETACLPPTLNSLQLLMFCPNFCTVPRIEVKIERWTSLTARAETRRLASASESLDCLCDWPETTTNESERMATKIERRK